MSPEFWLSIASLILTTAVGILTIIANIRITKISHLKDLHEYRREISYFELVNKDEKWLKEILDSGEFSKYSKNAQLKIIAWWRAYKKKHPPILVVPGLDDDEYEALVHTNLRDTSIHLLLGAKANLPEENQKILDDLMNRIDLEEFTKHLDDGDLDGTDW